MKPSRVVSMKVEERSDGWYAMVKDGNTEITEKCSTEAQAKGTMLAIRAGIELRALAVSRTVDIGPEAKIAVERFSYAEAYSAFLLTPESAHSMTANKLPKICAGLRYVYIVEAPDPRLLKIGKTGNPRQRLQGLAAISPVEIRLRALIACRLPSDLERNLHLRLMEHRLHGEWFWCGLDDALSHVREALRAGLGTVHLWQRAGEETVSDVSRRQRDLESEAYGKV